jgi:GTP-binding protein
MKVQFLLSTLTEFPALKDPQGRFLPEFALAGRSNVGKSSLINHLLGQKKVAKTSATPGKTQLLNFFLIDDSFLLVDLPGYGFAKAPVESVEKWSSAIDFYLNNRPTLKLLLLLIDCRREPNEQDLALIEWAKMKQMPLVVIFTKTDKLKTIELDQALKKTTQQLGCEIIPYSVENGKTRDWLIKRIRETLWA